MAKIQSVKLQIFPPTLLHPRRVKVSIKFSFTDTEREQRKQFQFSVSLRPKEIPFGDPGVETPSPAVLYWFKFGNGTRKKIAAIDNPDVIVSREVDDHVLNEDPKNHPISPTQSGADRDEVYASVALMTPGGPHVTTLDEKRSEVVTLTV